MLQSGKVMNLYLGASYLPSDLGWLNDPLCFFVWTRICMHVSKLMQQNNLKYHYNYPLLLTWTVVVSWRKLSLILLRLKNVAEVSTRSVISSYVIVSTSRISYVVMSSNEIFGSFRHTTKSQDERMSTGGGGGSIARHPEYNMVYVLIITNLALTVPKCNMPS